MQVIESQKRWANEDICELKEKKWKFILWECDRFDANLSTCELIQCNVRKLIEELGVLEE